MGKRQHTNSRPASSMRPLVFMLLVILLLLSPPFRPVRQQLSVVFQPITHGLYRLGVATSPFRSAVDPDESASRQAEATIARLEMQNQALRSQLGMASDARFQTVGADIIGQPVNSLGRAIRINRGSADGIETNMAVMADGYLVGKVVAVSQSHSDVQLITDPDFRLTATVGESSVAGLLVGSLGGMKLQRLPNTHVINIGDKVFSSSLGEQVPGGLPIGQVNGVREVDAVFYELDVETPVPLERISVVLVVRQ